jgi:molybdenum cofactor guanylyltransferase
MIGVILCGGESSRMGTDKGLLKNEARTWAQTAFDKLSALQVPVKFSVNKNQYTSYAELFSPAGLVTDNESLQLKGPLLGVLSTHLLYPGEDVFVLACDMLLMETAILKQLLKAYQTNVKAGAFVFTNNGEPEPLCCIYKSGSLDSIIQMYQLQQLSKHSMKFMLDHINTYTIALTDDQKKYFVNFNAHAELNGL